MRKAKFSTFTQIQLQNILWNLLLFLSCPPSRMYETSCTCEILHWTPHVHRLKLWTGSPTPAASWTFFFFTIWDTMVLSFIPVHVGPCWHILCSVQTRRNCVQVFNVSFNICPKNSTFKKKKKITFIYTGQIQNSEGTPAWSREGKKRRKKKETSNNVLVLLTYRTLVCCSVKLTAVECYLFIWIYFYEVCYWSELHIYFVNHECLCYKFVYFNNKCHTKQKRRYKIWIGYFKAFGPLSLEKLIYGTIHIFYWNICLKKKKKDFNLLTEKQGLVFWNHLSLTLNLTLLVLFMTHTSL